jgi:hypothetical protein
LIDTSRSHYLDLEKDLHYLREHFSMCRGATDDEIVDWAKFFLGWSKKARTTCGPWAVENLSSVEAFVKTLQKSKSGSSGYEVLERSMAMASSNLNREILASVRPPSKEKIAV